MNDLATSTRHHAVLLEEVRVTIAAQPGDQILDGTVGGGGHAESLLADSAPGGRLLGLDLDPAALARTAHRLERFRERVILAHGSFSDLAAHATRAGFTQFDRILLDLGFSSDQIEDPERGFSFKLEGPLDMRLDPGGELTAAALVNDLDEHELADLIYRFGDERASRRIAKAVVAARPLATTAELAATVAGALPARRMHEGIHPATRTFQALRIAVNDELATLKAALPVAIAHLRPGGRLAVISFHSLEDRIVKSVFKQAITGCSCPPELPVCVCERRPTMRAITRRPLSPDAAEVTANPRARSAKLRVAERLAYPTSEGSLG